MVMTQRSLAIVACSSVVVAGLWFSWSIPTRTAVFPSAASVNTAPDFNVAHSQATPDLRRMLQHMVTH
jgi:hypothetical protein